MKKETTAKDTQASNKVSQETTDSDKGKVGRRRRRDSEVNFVL